MTTHHIPAIASELALTPGAVQAVADLLAEGATIPFIARYRKEATGSLDEVAVTDIRDQLERRALLDARRDAILRSLEQNGHLTDELRAAAESAETMAVLEDLYLPYRPKRRTKATIAREKGLEPLADQIFGQTGDDPLAAAQAFVNPEKGVESIEDALEGARHILAERINENSEARTDLRRIYAEKAVFQTRVAAGKEAEAAKYRDYFEWSEPVATAPSHRIFAVRRGEREELLNLAVPPPEEEAVAALKRRFVQGDGPDSQQVALAAEDAFRRLLSRAMETEVRLTAKERAEAEAIRVFAENLRELLMAPPLGARRVMGVDPGFRTGCKVACLDAQGKLLHHDVFYLHQEARAAETVRKLVAAHDVEAIAVGNGTAGRETEAFLRGLKLPGNLTIVMVSESGASVYSASEVAREEFPDLDLTVRGAVSIGRRLMDPLSELVKIDPKAIGVGQYQHDVDQAALKRALDEEVMRCVNRVGVDVNRASVPLLAYVSGLGPQLARNIVAHRDENGPFPARKALLKVARLGPKAFEQSAGFLRISDGKNPLDASAVHPESYSVVDRMAKDLNCAVADLLKSAELRQKIDLNRYVTDKVGLPTLQDIRDELARPGRDPREVFAAFSFAEGVAEMADLEPGMRLPGIVTNVTAFGAFVDVGVHQDGLVHISELADRFVKDPAEIVKVQQTVQVTVLEVDHDRRRIALSMRANPDAPRGKFVRPSPDDKSAPARKRPPQKKGNGGPARRRKDEPFHNPLAEALRKRR
ncbi:MAG: Tex family protein [Desulfococcaceae bacterium]